MLGFEITALTPVQNEGDIGDVTSFQFAITRTGTWDPTFTYQVTVQLDRLMLSVFDVARLPEGDAATVIFTGNETQKTVTVTVRGDTVVENDELFRLTLSESGVQGKLGTTVQIFRPDDLVIVGSGSAFSLVLNDDGAGDIVADAGLIRLARSLGLVGEDIPTFARPEPEPPSDARLQAEQQSAVGDLISAALEDCELSDEERALIENAIDDPLIRADLNSKLEKALERCEEEHAEAEGTETGFYFVPYESGAVAVRSGTPGLDVAILAVGRESVLTVAIDPTGDIVTLDNDQTLVLTEIERIAFSDQTLALDIDGTSAAAYRLYQAAFDRVPDAEGLGFWIRKLDAGAGDLLWVANNFILSDEFESLYGANSSNEQFVDLLYENVLDRSPDAGGEAFWLSQLQGGAARAKVLTSFSESAENQENVALAIQSGIWYT